MVCQWHLWLWFCFSLDNRFFFLLLCISQNILLTARYFVRTVETKVHTIYAWKWACLFCHSVKSIQSKVELGFGFVTAMVTTTSFRFLYCYLVLRVGAGLLEGFFSQCCCSVLSFQPCLCSCASEGGHSPYSCSSPSRRLLLLITQCLSGWWWVQKGFCVFQVQPLS